MFYFYQVNFNGQWAICKYQCQKISLKLNTAGKLVLHFSLNCILFWFSASNNKYRKEKELQTNCMCATDCFRYPQTVK